MRKVNWAAIESASPAEKQKLAELALGRIFGILGRPFKDGDVEMYEECRAIIMACKDPVSVDWTPNYARDRNSGAQGD